MLCLLSWHWRLKVQGLTARMKQAERAAPSSGGNINTYDLSYDISSKALLHDIQSCCPIKHNTGACWCVPWPLNPKATSRMKKVFFKQSVLERTTACVTTTSLRNHDRIEALKFWYFIKKKMFPAPRLKSRPQIVVKQNVLSSSWSDDVIVTHPKTMVTSQQIDPAWFVNMPERKNEMEWQVQPQFKCICKLCPTTASVHRIQMASKGNKPSNHPIWGKTQHFKSASNRKSISPKWL